MIHCSISRPPENVMKTSGFLTFSGVIEMEYWAKTIKDVSKWWKNFVCHITTPKFWSSVRILLKFIFVALHNLASFVHLYNLKHVKNTHGGMLCLIKVTLLNVVHLCFQVFCIVQMIPNSPGRLICSLYHHIQTEKKRKLLRIRYHSETSPW